MTDDVDEPVEIELTGDAARAFRRYKKGEQYDLKTGISNERAVLHAVSDAEQYHRLYHEAARALRSVARHRDQLEGAIESSVGDLRRIAGSVVGVHSDDLQHVAADLALAVENAPDDDDDVEDGDRA